MKKENIEFNHTGFRDVFFSNGWRISFADSWKGNSIEGLVQFEKHLETEEVFVLLDGSVTLITAGKDSVPGKLQFEKLQPGKVYVVEQGEWHLSVFDEDGKVLIVENELESESVQYHLTSQIKSAIKNNHI